MGEAQGGRLLNVTFMSSAPISADSAVAGGSIEQSVTQYQNSTINNPTNVYFNQEKPLQQRLISLCKTIYSCMEREAEGHLDKYYIPPDAAESRFDTKRQPAANLSELFYRAEKAKVLLVLGDSGIGKSLFLRQQFRQACDKYQAEPISQPIPIWIDLATFSNKNQLEEQLLETYFGKKCTETSKRDITELKSQPLLFFLDSYDETGTSENLYHSNRWSSQWPCARFIIGCRTQALLPNHREQFCPNDSNQLPQPQALKELALLPFTRGQQQTYIERRLDTQAQQKYVTFLQEHPTLPELIANPLLLHMFLDILPVWQPPPGHIITRIDIYENFVSNLLARERVKRPKQKIDPKQHHEFYQQLACQLYFARRTLLKVAYESSAQVYADFTLPKPEEVVDNKWFEGKLDDSLVLLRDRGIEGNKQYLSFLHQSIWSYLVASRLIEESEHLAKMEVIEALSERPSYYFNRRLVQDEPLITQLMAEMILRKDLQQQLFTIIEHSKRYAHITLASANAMTLLCAARVSCSNKDLSGTRFAGAHLAGGVLDSTNLSNTDSRYVNYTLAWLADANLQKSQMQGAHFGQLPSLEINSKSDMGSLGSMGFNILNHIRVHKSNYKGILALTSFNGQLVAASLNGSNELLIWDLDSGFTKRWKLTTQSIRSLAFSPDGQTLIAGDFGGQIIWFNHATNTILNQFNAHREQIKGIIFHPIHNLIASGSFDKTIKILNLKSGQYIKTLTKHKAEVTGVRFSPDGKILASSSWDKTIKLWDTETWQCINTLPGHKSKISCVEFNQDGTLLASASWDNTIKLWDSKTGQCIKTLVGHADIASCIAFSSDDKLLVSGSNDKTIKLWDVNSGQCLNSYYGSTTEIQGVAFCNNDSTIVSGSLDNMLRHWYVTTTEQCLYKFTGHTSYITCINFSADSQWLVTGSFDNRIKRWHTETGQCYTLNNPYDGNNNGSSVALCPTDSSIIISSGDYDPVIRRWNTTSGQNDIVYQGHDEPATCIAMHPNGRQFLSGSRDLTIKLWNIVTGECIQEYEGHENTISSIAFSLNGELFASGDCDGIIILWDAKNHKELCYDETGGLRIDSIAFSPNNQFVASISKQGLLSLWSITENQLSFWGEIDDMDQKMLSCMTFLSNNYLIMGNKDGTINLFNVYAVKKDSILDSMLRCYPQKSWNKQNVSYESIAASSDGKWLALGTDAGFVSIYRCSLQEQTLYLQWSSHPLFNVSNVNINGAKGLTQNDDTLLTQHGAKGKLFKLSTASPFLNTRIISDILYQEQLNAFNQKQLNFTPIAPGSANEKITKQLGQFGIFPNSIKNSSLASSSPDLVIDDESPKITKK